VREEELVTERVERGEQEGGEVERGREERQLGQEGREGARERTRR